MPSGEAGEGHLVTLLNAVTTTGASANADLGDLRDEFSLFVQTTGSPTFSVQFQGSIDGTDWFSLGSAVTSATNGTTVSGTLARYVRANLTALSGGTLTAELAYSVALGASASSGGAGVSSVTAADASIVIGGTGSTPTIATGTLDAVAAQHPPAANWSNNSNKITSLQNGSSAQDAAAFGQITAANASALPLAGGTMSGVIAMGSHKVTGLTTGTAAADAANVGQANMYAPSAVKFAGVSGQQPRESFPFWGASANQAVSAGVMYLTALPVVPGDVITNVGFVTGTTAATFGTSGYHWWTALYTSAGAFIAQSADQANTAIASAHAYMLALGSPAPYTVPSNVSYLYAAVMINTGTGGSPVQPTIRGPSQNVPLIDSATSLWPTSIIYSASNGTSLGASAPTGTITLTASANLQYLGAS